MHFFEPAMLTLLVLIPLLILLYWLRLKRSRYNVTALFLWPEPSQVTNARFSFQRFKSSPTLTVQLLVLALLIASLARPAFRQSRLFSKGQVAIIVDNSASMAGLVEVGRAQTRFDLAKTVAHQLVDELGTESQMAILQLSNTNLFFDRNVTFTNMKQQLRQNIGQLTIKPTEIAPLSLHPDFSLNQVVFITDYHDPDHDSNPSVHRIYIGQSIENLAITKIELTSDLQRKPTVRVEVTWFNDLPDFSREPTVELQLLLNDVWFTSRFLDRLGGQIQNIFFDLSSIPPQSQILTAKLKIEDGLSLDNSASLIFRPQNRPELVLVNNRWSSPLNAFLATHPEINLTLVTTDTYNPNFGDIIVFDQIVPKGIEIGNPTKQNLLFINPNKDLPFAKVLRNNDLTVIADQQQNHPVMSKVPILDLKIRNSTHYQLPDWATILVSAVSSNQVAIPVIWVGEAPNGQRVGLISFDAFNLRQSRFPLMIPEMPLMVSQLIEWLTPPLHLVEEASIQTGNNIRLNQYLTSGKVSVRQPNGVIVDVTKPIFNQTDQIGIYTVLSDGQPIDKFTANLLSPNESNLSTGREIGDYEISLKNTKATLAQLWSAKPTYDWNEIWSYLVVLATIGLLVEWVIFRHRAQM